MSNNITPPPELVQQWCDPRVPGSINYWEDLTTRAAQWGYQQAVEELEAFLRKDHDKS
jgi:hypothetical protein